MKKVSYVCTMGNENTDKTNELLISVVELFMRYGIKSLTMDDISRHLGISKKTLYQHVSDKKDLVKKAFTLVIETDQCVMADMTTVVGNAIDEVFEINKMVSEKLRNVQPAVLYDIKKYYPDAWKVMEDHKKCFVYEMIQKNIEKGISEGLYRENVNAEIIAGVYITMMDKIFDDELFPTRKYTFETIHREIARYHIRGVANEKGIKYLVEKLNNDQHSF